MTKAARFLPYLPGTWHIDRQINVKGRVESKFQGLAHIHPTDKRGNFGYHEEGRLIGKDVTREGAHDYIYKIKDNTLTILFADLHRMGMPYVTLDFSDSVTAQDTYLCGDDIHAYLFEIISSEYFATEINISGTDKDYRLVTDFKRI